LGYNSVLTYTGQRTSLLSNCECAKLQRKHHYLIFFLNLPFEKVKSWLTILSSEPMDQRRYRLATCGLMATRQGLGVGEKARVYDVLALDTHSFSCFHQLRNAEYEAALKISLDAMSKEFEKLSKIDWMNSILFPEVCDLWIGK